MLNRLSDSKYFQFANKKYGYDKAFQKINFSDYIIPANLYIDRIGVFKGYKLPLVDEVIELVKAKKIIPCDFSTPSNDKSKTGNIFTTFKFPRQVFNLNGYNSDGEMVVYVDFSMKGKYMVSPQGIATYYDIPELTMFYMLVAGVIRYKLSVKPDYSNNPNFVLKIGESYALILSKIIDNMFPIITTTNSGYNKIFFLCMTFCLQNMFLFDKESAMRTALKSKFVTNKNDVITECRYYNSDDDIMAMADNNAVFPLDAFCNIILKEYDFIEAKSFNSNFLSIKFNERLTKNAVFNMDAAPCFINMLVLAKGSLGLYNDMLIKQYLQLANYDVLKEIAQVIKER